MPIHAILASADLEMFDDDPMSIVRTGIAVIAAR